MLLMVTLMKSSNKIPSTLGVNSDIWEEETSALNTQVGGSHYQLPIQPVDYIVKNNLGYREGNVIKYVTRHKDKNGAEDLIKAIHYLEMILEEYDDNVGT